MPLVIDVDECASDDPLYEMERTCINQIGTYDCTCAAGYKGINCENGYVFHSMMPFLSLYFCYLGIL